MAEGQFLRGDISPMLLRRNRSAACVKKGSVSAENGGIRDGATLPGSPSKASIRNSICPRGNVTYACICLCSSLRNSVSRFIRSQNEAESDVGVSCHFVPCFAIGAGDSNSIILVACVMRAGLTLTSFCNSYIDRPSGVRSKASRIFSTSSSVGKLLVMKKSRMSVSSLPLSKMSVASGAAHLLVIGHDRTRRLVVDDKAQVRLIEAHAQSHGRHQGCGCPEAVTKW